jgi:Flp pilus assembly protein TadD/chromosome segregation ATPase
MNRRTIALTAVALFAMAVSLLAEDPSVLFLRAYQDYQEGEKLERDGRLRDALNRFTSTVSILEKVKKEDPSWQEIVVDYRMRKAQVSVQRVQATIAANPQIEDVVEAPLPTHGFEIDIPEPAVNTRPNGTEPSAALPLVSTGGREEASLRRQVAEYRDQLAKLKDELERARGKATGARMELEKTKAELVATTSKFTQAEVALENTVAERDQLKAQAAEPQDKQVAKLSERIAHLEADNEVLNDENARLVGKLERAADYIKESKQVVDQLDKDRLAVAEERDKALARTKRLKENEAELGRLKTERIDLEKNFAKEKSSLEKQIASQQDQLNRLSQIEAENKTLARKLAEAEKTIAEATKSGATPETLAALQDEIALFKSRLESSRNELQAKDNRLKSLVAQLDEATSEAARQSLIPQPTDDQKRIAEENELLKTIVIRQIKDQNDRSQSVAALQQELEKLYVKSDVLSTQLAVLSRPQPKLSKEEVLIFRDPLITLNDPELGGPEVSLTVVKSTDASLPNLPQQPDDGGGDDLSVESRRLIVEAIEFVKQRRFTDAENNYLQVVANSPENYFALSNLAVTQIQANKLPAAQAALQKALSLQPGDVFSSVNLAIVYCHQARYDDAIEILNEVLKKDPQNAVAHNHMAIALGKKGNIAEAEKFFQRSILLDEKYAKAHFNLAVMYINSTPPSLELAKKHYEKAKSLGEDPDPVLESRLE